MQEHNLSAGNFEQCLKCDLCTSVCPMMEANPAYPGPKQAGPDGERYRLKDPGYFDLTLRFCLNCKRCEVACPSGVKVGDIIQTARLKYYRQHNIVRDLMLASTDAVGPPATELAWAVNPLLRNSTVKQVLDSAGGISRDRALPSYSRQRFVRWMKHKAPSQEGFKRYVSYFHGCYVNYNYPQLGRDFVTLMNACGYGVRLLEGERCCGVALISGGFGSRAARHARANVRSMERALEVSAGSGVSGQTGLGVSPVLAEESPLRERLGRSLTPAGATACLPEAVLTTSSTCTFTMRDEYPHLLGVDNSAVRSRLMMAVKWLYDRVEAGEVKLVWRDDFRLRAIYHTACHMNKLGWALFVIELLEMIPGMDLTVLDQECCGMAGTFGFKKENYGYSMAIGGKLFDHIRQASAGTAMAVRPAPPEDYPFGKGFAARKPSSDAFASASAGSGSAPSLAEGSSLRGKLGQGPAFANSAAAAGAVVITDCETCKWQIEAGTGLPVFNPISILVQALDLEATASLNAQA